MFILFFIIVSWMRQFPNLSKGLKVVCGAGNAHNMVTYLGGWVTFWGMYIWTFTTLRYVGLMGSKFLSEHHIWVVYGNACSVKRTPQRHAIWWVWTTCSKFTNHFGFNYYHNWTGLYNNSKARERESPIQHLICITIGPCTLSKNRWQFIFKLYMKTI